ncbi:MAG TPA: VWA domain-containing protein [Verrucomicrobiae bacterium]
MNFADFHFAEPRWLWLAAVAPIFLAGLFSHATKKRHEQLSKIASPNFIEQLTASHSPVRRSFKNILLLAAFAIAGLALARPQWGNVTTDKAWLGEDVVFCLDCSLSMTTSDVLPSRLQRAKFAMLDFVRKQSHGRVGLVAFAGSAFIQCPLTFDADAFEETLLSVDEKTIPIPGTDIGRALNEANRAMDKNAKHKIVVLVTDGEDLEKSGIAAAKRLATNGVVVFTIGVGTPAGKEIQTRNAAGQPELLRDAKGEIVRSQLDETTLREIAQVTGGSYYPLGTLGDGLTKVRSAIHALDRASGLRQSAKNGVDRFHWFIAALLLLLVVESLMGTRRKTISATMLLIPILLLPSQSAQAAQEINFPTPATARDFYNAGTRLLARTNFADAEQMFDSALAAQDESVRPMALFNLAHSRFDEGVELLKKGPDAQKVSEQGNAALAGGKNALRSGESALAENDLSKMIAAYLEGRGARHGLHDAEKAVQSAMETYGKTLLKWQRAADDFKGAAELNPADTNATHNAKIVERGIAKLVDEINKMQAMMGALGKQKQDLGKMLSKLKGQIPAPDAPPGAAGEDGDEDDGISPDSLAGQKENAARAGDQMQVPLSPDQAGQILDGLSIDGSRRLPMGDKQGASPKDKNGRNW